LQRLPLLQGIRQADQGLLAGVVEQGVQAVAGTDAEVALIDQHQVVWPLPAQLVTEGFRLADVSGMGGQPVPGGLHRLLVMAQPDAACGHAGGQAFHQPRLGPMAAFARRRLL